jgi:ZIP family zinc transporter
VLLITAISLGFIFLGVSSGAELREAGKSRPAVVASTAALGGTAVAGALGAAAALAFGAVAMMYLVTEELLVHAHRGKEGPAPAAIFFAGSLVYL